MRCLSSLGRQGWFKVRLGLIDSVNQAAWGSYLSLGISNIFASMIMRVFFGTCARNARSTRDAKGLSPPKASQTPLRVPNFVAGFSFP